MLGKALFCPSLPHRRALHGQPRPRSHRQPQAAPRPALLRPPLATGNAHCAQAGPDPAAPRARLVPSRPAPSASARGAAPRNAALPARPPGLTPRAVQLRPHAAPSQLEIPTHHRTPKIPSAVPGGTRTGQDGSGLTAADTARTAAVPCAPPRAAPEARTPPASRDRRAPQGLERSCTCANAAPPASRFPPPSSSWRTRPYCSHADDRWKREAVPV